MPNQRRLEADEARALFKAFKAITPGKSFQFAYIEAGADGRPMLLVDRRNVSEAARTARRDAKKKKMCRGTVSLKPDRTGYRFETDTDLPRFALHLVRYFGKAVPRLRRSDIVVGDEQSTVLEAAQGAHEDAREEAAALRIDQQLLRERIRAHEVRAVALGAEAQKTRSRYFQTNAAARQKAELAELAREEAAALRAEMRALSEAIAAAEEDAIALGGDDSPTIDARSDLAAAHAQLQGMLQEADQREAEETAARHELGALEDAAAALEQRVIAKERAALDAQVQAEVSRGSLYRTRSASRRRELVAQEARRAADALRAKLDQLDASVATAHEAVAQAAAARLQAREASAVFLDRYEDAERDWWCAQQISPAALVASSAALEGPLSAEAAALAAARSQEAHTSAAREALQDCTLLLDDNIRQQETLRARIAAIRSGSVQVDAGVVGILSEAHAALGRLQRAQPALQAEKSAAEVRFNTQQGKLDEARATARAAEAHANAARLDHSAHAMPPAEHARVAARLAELPLAHEEIDGLRDEVSLLRDQEAAANAAVQDAIDARRHLEAAHAELSLLVLEEQALQRAADRWSFGRQSRREAIAEARAALIDVQARRTAASRDYDDASAALSGALEAASGHRMADALEARVTRLRREQTLATRDRELAELEVQLTSASARAAALSQDHLQQAHDAHLASIDDPDLQAARERQQAAQADAAAVFDALLGQEQQLGALLEAVEAASATLADDSSQATVLADALEQLSEARASAQTTRLAADHAAAAAEAADAAVQAEVHRLSASDPLLRAFSAALSAAALESNTAAARDVAATAHRESAERAQQAAQRAALTAGPVAEMGDYISAHQHLLDTVHVLHKPERIKSGAFEDDALVDDQLQRSETLDLSLPAHAQRLRAAIAARADGEDGEDGEDGTYRDLLAFQEGLERRAAVLLAIGATAEELQSAFARIPNGLRPPSYRVEVAAFHALESAFAEAKADADAREREAEILGAADALVAPEQRLERVRETFLSMGGSLSELDALTAYIPAGMEASGRQSTEGGGWDTARLEALGGEAGVSNPALVVHLDNVFSSLGALTGAVGAVGQFVEAAGMDTADPIAKKMQQDKLLDATLSAVSAVIQNTKQFGAMDVAGNIPLLGVLGTIDQAKLLAENIVHAAVRRGKASYDRLLADAARVAGSPLAGAFEESVDRERQLWARHGLDATANAATIAAHILRGVPASFAIGVALQIAATAASVGNQIAHSAIDRTQASRAAALLRAARRGDAGAKTELFQNHARYAKGLIAHMATQGDRFALRYADQRGVDEQMIAQSSAKILAHYLLVQAEQDAEPETWEQLRARQSDRLAAAGRIARRALTVSNPVTLATFAVQQISAGQEPVLDPEKLSALEDLQRTAAELVDHHRGARDLRERVSARLAVASDAQRPGLLSQLSALSALIERYDTFFAETQDGAVASLRELSHLQDTIETLDEIEVFTPHALAPSGKRALAEARLWVSRLQQALSEIAAALAAAA